MSIKEKITIDINIKAVNGEVSLDMRPKFEEDFDLGAGEEFKANVLELSSMMISSLTTLIASYMELFRKLEIYKEEALDSVVTHMGLVEGLTKVSVEEYKKLLIKQLEEKECNADDMATLINMLAGEVRKRREENK